MLPYNLSNLLPAHPDGHLSRLLAAAVATSTAKVFIESQPTLHLNVVMIVHQSYFHTLYSSESPSQDLFPSLALISSYLSLATSLTLPCIGPHHSYHPAPIFPRYGFPNDTNTTSAVPCKVTLSGHQPPPTWQHAGRPRLRMPGYPSCFRSTV